MRWLGTVGSLVALVTAQAVAAQTAARQPSSNWVVDFDAAQCVASRNYGTREQPLLLALKAPPLGHVMQLVILRPGSGPRMAEQVEGTTTFDAADPIRLSMLIHGVREQRILRVNIPLDKFAPIRTARSMSIKAKGQLSEQFELSQMEPLLKMMDTCVADLRQVWNVLQGEAVHPRLREPASGDLRGVFRSSDYPAAALTDMSAGRVGLAVLVDEAGKVADCTVIETSGVAVLDAQSCAIVQDRARFKPAVRAGR